MASFLALQNLTVSYGGTAVVKGISLDCAAGSVTCLIGANGAGKTTALRAISGLIMQKSGSVQLDGVELIDAPAHTIASLGVAHVPEGRQVFANMTVDENLRMGAFLVSDAGDVKRRRDRVLARLPRLREKLTQFAGLLSGGEQQMLAIGRALMGTPRALLLDEPSMGLAPLMVEEIFRIVGDLKREGQTILLVEQNASLALEIADRAYVLENGYIRLSGSAAEIAKNPDVASAYLGGEVGLPHETGLDR